jgi:hypothetical protein
MSPPLVVAFALAGRIDRDLSKEPLGQSPNGEDVFLRDVWPTMEEVGGLMQAALDAETYRTLYSNFAEQNPMWNEIPTSTGLTYQWDWESTYIQEPPFFEGFGAEVGKMEDLYNARPLAIFGDSVTTDHITWREAYACGRAKCSRSPSRFRSWPFIARSFAIRLPRRRPLRPSSCMAWFATTASGSRSSAFLRDAEPHPRTA